MDKKDRNKTSNYLKKEGFYVALFVCLCIVAAVAAVTIKSGNSKQPVAVSDDIKKPEKNTNTSTNNPSNATQVYDTKVDPKGKTAIASTPTPAPAATIIPATAPVVATAAKPVLNFIKPVAGSLLIGFSDLAQIEPTDSKTIQSVETVNGIYINCKLGQDVFAAESGTVVDSDAAINFGQVLTIKHENGYETVYGNLAEKPNVKTGDRVVRGQKIAAVGKTSNHYPSYKALDAGFIYFQVLKNQVPVDPVSCNIKY